MAEPLIVEKDWTYRRYLLIRALTADRMQQVALALTWRGILNQQPAGPALPATFPFRARLIAAGYSDLELLDGVTENELAIYAGFYPLDAKAIVAAAVNAIAALDT